MTQLADFPSVGSSFQDLVAFLGAGAPAPLLRPERFMQAMHIDVQTFASQAKVHRNTVKRAWQSRSIQDYLRESMRAIKAATDINGDLGSALSWYRNEPIAVFAYKTPEMLVVEGRVEDLLRYVSSLDAGAAG